jgi:hypothetical protein
VQKRGLRGIEEARDRRLDLRRPDQFRIDDLLPCGVRPDHELLAQVVAGRAGGRQPVVVNHLAALARRHEDRSVLPVGSRFRERREAGEDQRLAGARTAQEITARLPSLRLQALDRLSEVVDPFRTDALQEGNGDRGDSDLHDQVPPHMKEHSERALRSRRE